MSWIDANGISFNYRWQGNPEGPLVVLMHEIGGCLEGFEGVVPHLAKDFSLLSFDQRGSGLSEKVRSPFTADDLVDDVVGLMAELGLDGGCSFVTVAAAGLQALRFYQRYPERVGAIAMCNPALGVEPSRAKALEERADLAARAGIRAGLDTTLDKSYPHELRDEEVFRNYRGRYLANDPYGFAESNRVLARTDLRHLIGTLKCPVLVAAGKFDQVRTPQTSEEVARQIAGCRFELLDGGHFLPATAPDALGRVLHEFFASTQG